MKGLNRKHLLDNTYEYIEASNGTLIEETIKKVQDILGFKKIIAFSGGGSGVQLGTNNTELEDKIKSYSDEIKCEYVDKIMKRLRDYNVAILTGGTTWDIPKIGLEMAKKYDLPTIGVLPKRGEKDSMGKEYLNIEIVVPPFYGESHYGDESSIFAKLADGVFMIGGGAGTLIEFSHIMKINEALHKHKNNIKKIIPITGIPGVAEATNYIPGNQEIKTLTFPDKNITDPKDAFDLMKKELCLDDIFREEY